MRSCRISKCLDLTGLTGGYEVKVSTDIDMMSDALDVPLAPSPQLQSYREVCKVPMYDLVD